MNNHRPPHKPVGPCERHGIDHSSTNPAPYRVGADRAIYDSEGHRIARMMSGLCGDEQADRNADMICRSLNSHAALEQR